jgi:predicted flap endonuclease-1-like 5' DNA nuclease
VSEKEAQEYEKQLTEQLKAGVITIKCPDGAVISTNPKGDFIKRIGIQVITLARIPFAPSQPPKIDEPVVAKVSESVVQTQESELETKGDDLTALPKVGAGRMKKLNANGIVSFGQLADMKAVELVRVLGAPLTEDTAQDIINAAKEVSSVS